MTIHVTPIPRLTTLTTPAFTLTTANAAGSAITSIASDSSLALFDTTLPATLGSTAAVGSAAVASRRDHSHGGGGGNLDLGAYKLVGNGGSTGIAISANGEITMAAQPCALAFNSATDDNVTGNGAATTIDFNTEQFDQNGDFAGDAFVAPVAGKYLFSFHIRFQGGTANLDKMTATITGANISTIVAAYGGPNPGSQAGMSGAAIIDCDASDSVTIVLIGTGESGNVIDISGGSTAETWYCAELVA
jgi:hypothetical protein